ncbi:hypothetical protein QLR68_17895, partial [Micromonospora sp. DH15]|nr:hypothetical protein [Micromonospora sp. DH15]
MTDSAPVDGQPTVPMPVASPPAAPAPPQTAAAVPEAAPGLPVPAVAAEDAPEGPPARLWDRMREDPQYAPEHLALEAVRADDRSGPGGGC